MPSTARTLLLLLLFAVGFINFFVSIAITRTFGDALAGEERDGICYYNTENSSKALAYNEADIIPIADAGFLVPVACKTWRSMRIYQFVSIVVLGLSLVVLWNGLKHLREDE